MKKNYSLSRIYVLVLLFGLFISLISCGGSSSFIKRDDALKDDSLACYISFDENSGDTIAEKFKSSIENKSPEDLNWKKGKFNSSINFNGSDAYLLINNKKCMDLGNKGGRYTVCLWINSTAAGSKDWLTGQVITEKRTTDGRKRSFLIYLNHNNSVGTHFEEPHEEVEGKKPINDGNWHHVAVIHDADTIKIYIDAELDAEGRVTDNDKSTSGSPITIGCRRLNNGNPSAYYKGQVDDYFIFTRALSQDEIRVLMEN